jgi:hypothetical protein
MTHTVGTKVGLLEASAGPWRRSGSVRAVASSTESCPESFAASGKQARRRYRTARRPGVDRGGRRTTSDRTTG